jgi:PAS domain-containing protein
MSNVFSVLKKYISFVKVYFWYNGGKARVASSLNLLRKGRSSMIHRKRIAAILAAVLMIVSFSGAEASSTPPIRILFNGEPLSSDAPPFLLNGTAFVPFRILFERLGMKVDWNPSTRTVTGRNEHTTIVLPIGSKTAAVNGSEMTMLEAPRTVGGRTFVPLRFVSESAKAEVSWDGPTRTVTVEASRPQEDKKESVIQAYKEYLRFANEEDAEGVLAMIHPESKLRAAVRTAVADAFGRRDVVTVLESIEVEGLQPNQAVLSVTERNEKKDGAFFVNHRAVMKATMRKSGNDGWKLFAISTVMQQWLTPFGEENPMYSPDAEDKTIAENTIASYMEALEQEDAEEALRWIAQDSPERSSTEAALRWMFAAYDFIYELEALRVLDRGGDEIYVYTVQTIRKQTGPKFADLRSESIYTLRLQPNGLWRIYSTWNGNTEPLSLPQ